VGGVGSVQYGRVKKNGAVADDPGGQRPHVGRYSGTHEWNVRAASLHKDSKRKLVAKRPRGCLCVGWWLPSGTTGKEN